MTDERPLESERDLTLSWSARLSLTPRILAVNIFALALLAGGFFYLDSYRSRILDGRLAQAGREARLIADALAAAPPERRDTLALGFARDTGARLRLYDASGKVLVDTRSMGSRNAVLIDPDKQPWQQDAARFLDAVIDTVVGAQRAPLFREKASGLEWADVRAARDPSVAHATVWRAPDRSPVITAAAAYGNGATVFTVSNARDITQTVRLERYRLGVVLAIVSAVSVLLSLFLARTIVRPLRRLARAAVRVRLGRAREVVVPRLPSRRDEIGLLARALSDMSGALRQRIDATEAFAADVTHELKNPLASLRSAVDGLGRIKDPALQDQLIAVIRDDVLRLDRLITDISDASRLDAQLSRAKFEPVDIGVMLDALTAQRIERGVGRNVRLNYKRRRKDRLIVRGEGTRLERVFENLIDNALSFSPDGSEILLTAKPVDNELVVAVEDEGPGVPEDERESIFRRFHSVRPESEAFGQHSGLGLAIARTIVEGHGGQIMVEDRTDSSTGARFVVRLPMAGEA